MAEYIDKIMCPSCGKTMAAIPTNFFTSYSPRHQGCRVDSDKQFVPFCKNCIQDILVDYNLSTVKEALYLCDKPFLKEVWNTNYENEKNKDKEKSISQIFGNYIKILSLNHKELRFKDSDSSGKYDNDDNDDMGMDFTPSESDIVFWGKGYSDLEYYRLNTSFTEWVEECQCNTLAERKIFKQICIKELEIDRGREQKDNVDKQVESLQKLMNDAGVKPKDINVANDPSNAMVLGMRIKEIESTRPAELYDDPNKYKDYFNLGEYFTRFVLRPLKNLLTGTRDFDTEFNLEEDDNDG